jgi:hypothetical protein
MTNCFVYPLTSMIWRVMAAVAAARCNTSLALAASGPGKEKLTMKRIRRLLEGRTPDVSAGSGVLAMLLALLLIGGIAACIAIAADRSLAVPAKQKGDEKLEVARPDEPEQPGYEKDLVVYYSFDDDAQGIVYDQSGNGNHGRTVGDVRYEDCAGGRAPCFTSNQTYIVSDARGLNMHGWREATVSVWFKTNRVTTYSNIMSRGEVTGDTPSGLKLRAGSDVSKAYFGMVRQFSSNPAVEETLYTSSLMPKNCDRVGKWIHMAATFDGQFMRLYINGKLDRQMEASSERLKIWDQPENKLVIGNASLKSRMAWTDKYFDGLIDEVRIWRRSLSDHEISALYEPSGPRAKSPID